jgi:hypothetical protein
VPDLAPVTEVVRRRFRVDYTLAGDGPALAPDGVENPMGSPVREPCGTSMLRTCYTTVFSALVIRVAYGPGFAADPVDDATFATQLARMISLYLLTAS